MPFQKGYVPSNKIQDEFTDLPLSRRQKLYYRKRKAEGKWKPGDPIGTGQKGGIHNQIQDEYTNDTSLSHGQRYYRRNREKRRDYSKKTYWRRRLKELGYDQTQDN